MEEEMEKIKRSKKANDSYYIYCKCYFNCNYWRKNVYE